MALVPHYGSYTDTAGNAISGATVTITDTLTGAASSIFTDVDGLVPVLGNVILTDERGTYSFYAASGRYTLTITASGYDTITRNEALWDEAVLSDIAININSVNGVDPTGVSDSTAALNAFFATVDSGSKVRFRGAYDIGQILIEGKNLTLDCMGSTFNLNGNKAGFLVHGTVTQFDVLGGVYIGDGTARTGPSGNGQICLSFGNESGAQVSNVNVYGAHMSNAGQGIRFADGRGGGGTKAENCHAYGCTAVGMVNVDLTDGGMGYGFLAAQADGSGFTDCTADSCQRHGFYFSEGKNYTGTGLKAINCGRGTGVRGAVVVSRSANVVLDGVIAAGNADCGLVIDTDSAGLAPDNVLDGVVVNGYIAYDNDLGDIIVGTTDPSADGVPKNVTIRGRTRAAASFSAASGVLIHSGQRIKIDVDIDGSAAAATYRAVTLDASDGATYTSDVEITGSIDSGGYGIQIASALQAGTTRLLFKPSRISCAVAEFEFLGGEDATTNNNLLYSRGDGIRPYRTVTTTGAGVTIPVGGLGGLTFSPASSLTVLQFSGAIEGQELTLFFTNGNTTLLNTNFYLVGAGTIVGTANDVVKVQYLGGAWRQSAPISLN